MTEGTGAAISAPPHSGAMAPAANTAQETPERFPSPLHLIWRRLSRPYNLVKVIPVLCGIPRREVADLLMLHLALSVEAEALLAETHDMLRNLGHSTTLDHERCAGFIRGQVLWAETLTARANGFGVDDVFVCGLPRRDFDIAENQVLAASLALITRSAIALDSEAARHLSEEQRSVIAHRSDDARTVLRSNLLRGVRRARPSARSVARSRHGRRANQYRPAVEMYARRHEPIRPDELLAACDDRTVGQHRALALVMLGLQRRGLAVPQLHVVGGELTAGPIKYRNWRQATPSGNHGILIGDVLVDGATDRGVEARVEAMDQLARRGEGRRICVVTNTTEADLAVTMALEGTRWGELSTTQ